LKLRPALNRRLCVLDDWFSDVTQGLRGTIISCKHKFGKTQLIIQWDNGNTSHSSWVYLKEHVEVIPE